MPNEDIRKLVNKRDSIKDEINGLASPDLDNNRYNPSHIKKPSMPIDEFRRGSSSAMANYKLK